MAARKKKTGRRAPAKPRRPAAKKKAPPKKPKAQVPAAAPAPAPIDPERVATKDMSRILRISQEHLRRLAKKNVLNSVARGKYRLADAVQAYIKYREEGSTAPEGVSLKHRLSAEQIRKLELQNDETAGRLIGKEAVRQGLAKIFTGIRKGFMAVPSRLAPVLAGIKKPAGIKKALNDEITRVLEHIAGEIETLPDGGRPGGSSDPPEDR